MIRAALVTILLAAGSALAATNPFSDTGSSAVSGPSASTQPRQAPGVQVKTGAAPGRRQDGPPLPQVPIPQLPGARSSLLPPGPGGLNQPLAAQDSEERHLLIIGIVNDMVAIKDARDGDVVSVRNRTLVKGICFVDYPTMTCGPAGIELAKTKSLPAASQAVPAKTTKAIKSIKSTKSTKTTKTGDKATGQTITAVKQRGNSVTIAFKGGVPEYAAYAMNEPRRYVVDLKKAASTIKTVRSATTDGPVQQVRIGSYADGVRIAIDLKDAGGDLVNITSEQANSLTFVFSKAPQESK